MHTKLFLIAIIFINILLYSQSPASEKAIQKNELNYLSNNIVIKFKVAPLRKSNNEILLADNVLKVFNEVGMVSSKSLFEQSSSKQEFGLDRISVVKYSSEVDPLILASKISKLEEVEWAEPKFIYPVEFVPNDQFYSSQYAMIKIKAQEAWDVSTGDTSVVIAIIDSGVDWDHPDLAANIWRNWGETPGNGIDDDFNGYVDDVRGWDFGGLNGTPDYDPMEDRPDHGTHVAGDASAVTDNSTGVASIGYKSKIMPIKTSRDDFRSTSGSPFIVYGYEGIKYAADNGAKIINCSWGGGGYSLLGQEVINYATSVGALVVAAAGNDNSFSPFYPASYQNVLSVAATDESDFKSSFSNYGAYVDVSAPGSSIYSTWQNDTYRYGSGTSFASPIVAGLAALVRAKFPLLSPNQIAELIRTNCDDINSVNPGFVNRLGRGRVNAYKSLSNTTAVSVRAKDVKFSDELPGGDGDGVFEAGETIQVTCKFVNYLAPTSTLGIYLESGDNYSSVQNGIFLAGSRATLDSFSNNTSAYTFQISPSVPQNSILTFNLNYVDASYQDFQLISVIANPTYSTQAGDDIALTITSKGTLGFNDYPGNLQGDGFKYLDGSNLLFEGALILATSPTQVSDAARGAQQGSSQNNDFTTVQPFVLNSPGTIADVEGTCIINDDNAGTNKLGLVIKLNSFSFNDLENQNYILLKYDLTNKTTSIINNLYAGLFFDWDFADAANDFTAYDTLGNFGYAYRVGGNPDTWVGSSLVSAESFGFWAINNQGGDGGFSIYDGFSDTEKWQSISSGIGKPQAGAGDISLVVSGGPYSIQPDETAQVAFVVAAGLNLNDLRTAVANARVKYSQIPTSVKENELELPKQFYLSQNYPNPFNPSTKISWQAPASGNQVLRVFDVLGNEMKTLVNEWKGAGSYEVEFDASKLASGVYYYQLRVGEFIQTRKMILLR